MIIRTKDNFYPNVTVLEDEKAKYIDNGIVFTTESKAGNVRRIELDRKEIVAIEDTNEEPTK